MQFTGCRCHRPSTTVLWVCDIKLPLLCGGRSWLAQSELPPILRRSTAEAGIPPGTHPADGLIAYYPASNLVLLAVDVVLAADPIREEIAIAFRIYSRGLVTGIVFLVLRS
jgi:hypothetical protein